MKALKIIIPVMLVIVMMAVSAPSNIFAEESYLPPETSETYLESEEMLDGQEKAAESQQEETVVDAEPEVEIIPEEERVFEKQPEMEMQAESLSDPYADIMASESILTGLDFSSKRILVATEDPTLITDPSVVVSEYNGVHLLQFDDEETAKKAYLYYYDKADFVEVDTGLQIADGFDTEEPVESNIIMTEEDNPFTQAQEQLRAVRK